MVASALAQNIDLARVANAFQRGLPTYHAEAKVQQQIAAQLADMIVAHIDQNMSLRGFEFGCGTGHLTSQLTSHLNFETLIVNDLVSSCEKLIVDIAPNAIFRAGAVDDLNLPAHLNLIASSSVVQWLPDLQKSLERFSAHLAANGLLALSGFGPAHFHELKSLGVAHQNLNYIDVADWPRMLPDDLEIVALKKQTITVHFQSFLTLLAHLRDTGVNGIAGSRLTKSKLFDLARRYETRLSCGGDLPLTYLPVWVLARKKA